MASWKGARVEPMKGSGDSQDKQFFSKRSAVQTSREMKHWLEEVVEWREGFYRPRRC